ncbi:Zn(2)-C6 fungal-type domain-containing protein [Fusarium sp. Ph1]|nr:Zn(2)-C6 fungal-type domain-containing protein [Fusarium sp. Ph1]
MPPRACDACKRRKVKCNGTQPCGTCCVSNIACQYTIIPRKRGPKVARLPERLEHPSRQMVNEGGIRSHLFREDHSQGQPSTPSTADLQSGYSPREWPSPNIPVFSPGSDASNPSQPFGSNPQMIWEMLITRVNSVLSSVSMLDVVDSCIDIYMQYGFPCCPIVHEKSLRESNVELFSAQSSSSMFRTSDEQQLVRCMRAFASLTAVCAAVSAMMPQTLLPYRHLVVQLFLRASRDMLYIYEDYDLEHPDSSSLLIRMFHSTALQHTTGKTGAAWSISSQAALLAQRMRLYDERDVRRSDPIETQLLRFRFWHLYVSDQAASLMRNRVFVLQESLFDGDMILDPFGEGGPGLLDKTQPRYHDPFEDRAFSGYDLTRRLWASAAGLMASMRKYARQETHYEPDAKRQKKMKMTGQFLEFTSMVDELPPWFESPDTFEFSQDKEVLTFQRAFFSVQRSNLMLGLHCFHLVLLQQAIEYGLSDIMGLHDQDLTLAMKKTEIIHEFLVEVSRAPLLCLRVQGEPTVERFRRVGSALLEVIQNVDNETIRTRSRSYLTQLLDTLSRLDSKASDKLNSEQLT